MVSIHRPLGYGPSTLPLRHSASRIGAVSYPVYIRILTPTVHTQAQLSQSSEKERSAVEKELTLRSRVGTLETQLSGTKQEKSQLLATLELERAKLQTLEESQQRYTV